MCRNRNGNKGSCCFRTLSVLVLLIVILGGAFYLLWQFVLNDEQKENISNAVNETQVGGGNGGGGNWMTDENGNTDLINAIPGANNNKNNDAPESTYEFMQCTSGENCCNGLNSVGFCNLRVNEVLYGGVHNAMATDEDGFILPNHEYSLENSLVAGYRALNVDVAVCFDGTYKFVHSNCALGNRNVVDTLRNINTFIVTHPTEILLLNVQFDDDAGSGTDVDILEFYNLMKQADNITDSLYTYDVTNPNEVWPTLRELKQRNQRIIFSIYNGHQTCSTVECPTGFHDWFTIGAESEFVFPKIEDVQNISNSCPITRGGGPTQRWSNIFWGINLFLSIPSKTASSTTLNTKSFITNHIQQCSSLNNNNNVNVLFVDFWSVGNVPEVVQIHNTKLGNENNMNSSTSDQNQNQPEGGGGGEQQQQQTQQLAAVTLDAASLTTAGQQQQQQQQQGGGKNR